MKQIRILEKFEAWYVNIWSPLLPSSLTTKNKMKEAFKAGCNVAYKQAFENVSHPRLKPGACRKANAQADQPK